MDQPLPTYRYLDFGGDRLRLVPLGPLAWPALRARAVGDGEFAMLVLAETRLQWRDVQYSDGRHGDDAWDWADLSVEVARLIVEQACLPLLSDDEAKELAQLAGHLRFEADFPKINCENCRKMQENDGELVDCGQCGFIPVPQALEPLMEIHRLAGGAGVDGARSLASLCRDLGQGGPMANFLQLRLLTDHWRDHKSS